MIDLQEVPAAYKTYVAAVHKMPLPEALLFTEDIDRFIPILLLENLEHRVYAPGKWTVKDILQHMIDTERIFQYRALKMARENKPRLTSFDENVFAANGRAGNRRITDLAEEFKAVRQSTVALFSSFDKAALDAQGFVSDKTVSVALIGYVIAGHMLHHMQVIREKYIPLLRSEANIHIENFRPELAVFFEKFNKAWIEQYFHLEPLDIEVLENPQRAIIDRGGEIYFATFEGRVIGAVALMKLNDGIYELTKMAVDERYRGLGAGKILCLHAIEKAKEKGADKLVLYTQDSLRTALDMYHRMGFQQVPLEPGVYDRANVKMEMPL